MKVTITITLTDYTPEEQLGVLPSDALRSIYTMTFKRLLDEIDDSPKVKKDIHVAVSDNTKEAKT